MATFTKCWNRSTCELRTTNHMRRHTARAFNAYNGTDIREHFTNENTLALVRAHVRDAANGLQDVATRPPLQMAVPLEQVVAAETASCHVGEKGRAFTASKPPVGQLHVIDPARHQQRNATATIIMGASNP